MRNTLALITDLDGTFLGGDPATRFAITHWIRSHSAGRLVYCTGRSVDSVQQLISAGDLPLPDAIIGDVGTSLWTPEGEPLFPDLHEEINSLWGDGHRVVPEKLNSFGLRAQSSFGPRRYSYWYDDEHVPSLPIVASVVRRLGYDPLISGGRYFDVLPRGINKGWAVNALVQRWGLRPQACLVAGDTLNDLAMLLAGIPAVVVANAEQPLLDALAEARPENAPLHYAKKEGADGILEVLRSLNQAEAF